MVTLLLSLSKHQDKVSRTILNYIKIFVIRLKIIDIYHTSLRCAALTQAKVRNVSSLNWDAVLNIYIAIC